MSLNLRLNIYGNYRLRASKFETSFEINPPFYPFTINKIYIKRREKYEIDEKYSLEEIESKLVIIIYNLTGKEKQRSKMKDRKQRVRE